MSVSIHWPREQRIIWLSVWSGEEVTKMQAFNEMSYMEVMNRNDDILDVLMICFWALNSTHREMPQLSSLCHLAALLLSNQVMLQQAGHAEEGGIKQKAWISSAVKTQGPVLPSSLSFIAKHLLICDKGSVSIISRHLLKSFSYQVWHDFRSLWEQVFPDYLCSHSGGSRRWTSRKPFQLLSHSLTYCQGEKVNVPSPVGFLRHTETCLLHFIARLSHSPFISSAQWSARSEKQNNVKRRRVSLKHTVRYTDEMDGEPLGVRFNLLLCRYLFLLSCVVLEQTLNTEDCNLLVRQLAQVCVSPHNLTNQSYTSAASGFMPECQMEMITENRNKFRL